MPEQTRILFVTRKWRPSRGGMETYSVELCQALSELSDLEVVHPPEVAGTGRSPSHLAGLFLHAAGRIAARRRDCDVLHLGDMVLYPLALGARALGFRGRIVMTVHGLDMIYGDRRGLTPALYRLFTRCARRLGGVDLFLANSSNTARIATKRGFTPVSAVPLGCRPDIDSPLPSPDTDAPYALYIGRLVPRKGAQWFAREVMPHLPDNLRLVVVGNPWDPEVVSALRQDPRVEMPGEVDDAALDKLIRGASFGVMPNLPSEDAGDVEGFGLVALDFARLGVPVLASALEGITDAVCDGRTGFLVRGGDAEAFAGQAREILAWTPGQRASWGADARRMTASFYDWRVVAGDTLSAYGSV